MEVHAGVWVVIAIYFLMLFGILIWVKIWGAHADQHNKPLESHYLAGRKLGAVVLGTSLAASLFSGYTVVGIPAEAFVDGFSAWRWIGSCVFIYSVITCYGPRLNFLSRQRDYVSTLDWPKDRFGIEDPVKSIFHWVLTLVVTIPCFVYLIAQFVAFSSTISSLSGDHIPFWAASIFLGFMIVMYEVFGGLRAVALTDVLQGSILLVGSLMVFVFVQSRYGGLSEITSALEISSPEHVEVMSSSASLSWAVFWIGVGLQRGLFPDFIQRSMASKDQGSQKMAHTIALVMPFLIQTPLAIVGLIGRVKFPDVNRNSVFAEVINDIINHDTLGYVLGSVTMAASLAAIMSTADSVMIVTSQIITTEIVTPVMEMFGLFKQKKPAPYEVKIVGVIITVLIAAICIPIANSDADLSQMIQFQSAFLAEIAPIYMLAPYWNKVKAFPTFVGLVVSLAIGIPLVDQQTDGNIIYAVGINFFLVISLSLLVDYVPTLDCSNFLTASSGPSAEVMKLISWKRPTGYDPSNPPPLEEPIWKRWWMFAVVCIIPWFAIPFYRNAGEIDPQWSGTPAWAACSLLILASASGTLFTVIQFNWKPGDDDLSRKVDLVESGDTGGLEMAMQTNM